MKVYSKLPMPNKFVDNNPSKRALPVVHGWFDKMDSMKYGEWLMCKSYPIEKRDTPYGYAYRYNKIYPDYRFVGRQISENEVALFGRRKQ